MTYPEAAASLERKFASPRRTSVSLTEEEWAALTDVAKVEKIGEGVKVTTPDGRVWALMPAYPPFYAALWRVPIEVASLGALTRKEQKSWRNWFLTGYKDGQERTPYKRAPGPEPPPVPDDMLPLEWQAYLDGWRTGVQDSAVTIAMKKKAGLSGGSSRKQEYEVAEYGEDYYKSWGTVRAGSPEEALARFVDIDEIDPTGTTLIRANHWRFVSFQGVKYLVVRRKTAKAGLSSLGGIEWRKAQSVTTGGKPYFWVGYESGQLLYWVVWDRIESKWAVTDANRILAYFNSAAAGKKWAESH